MILQPGRSRKRSWFFMFFALRIKDSQFGEGLVRVQTPAFCRVRSPSSSFGSNVWFSEFTISWFRHVERVPHQQRFSSHTS